jgi:hypothetical protein
MLLVGGAVADRLGPRRLLVGTHCGLALLLGALALLASEGGATYPRIVAFAVAAGALNALASPARDAQLYPIARAWLSRGVVGTNVVAQIGQAIGGLAAAGLAALGAPAVLGVQAALALGGALPAAALPDAPREGGRGEPRVPLASGVAGALRFAARSPVLRPVFGLTVAVGLLFVGPYTVVLPLLARDVYAGGAREMGILMAMLPVGGIAAGLVIFARGGIRRDGRAVLLGQAFAALCIGSIAAAPPLAGAAAGVLGWGVGSAYFLAAGRTLALAAAPEAQRATLLALYTLCILGAGPLGSLLSGWGVALFGPHRTLAVQAAAMLACVALAARRTGIARI